MRELTDFIKKGLSNDDGSPSFARQGLAVILYFMICWETYLVSKLGSWVDIPGNWLILVLAMWTVAKGAETIKAKITATTEVAKDANQPPPNP
jgi:hypothetical protein